MALSPVRLPPFVNVLTFQRSNGHLHVLGAVQTLFGLHRAARKRKSADLERRYAVAQTAELTDQQL